MSNIKVGLSDSAFFSSFKKYFPELKIIRSLDEVKQYDLIIFPGGEDISPSTYNRELTYSMGVNPNRDYAEINILSQATNLNKKILGVCRGHQLICSQYGFVLLQDLYYDAKIKHDGNHELKTEPDSMVGKIFEKVNSLHHQGVILRRYEDLKYPNLRITSVWDGIIESCETNNIITVQFHPEFMWNEFSKEFFKEIEIWVKEETPKKLIKNKNKELSIEEYFSEREEALKKEKRQNTITKKDILAENELFNKKVVPEQATRHRIEEMTAHLTTNNEPAIELNTNSTNLNFRDPSNNPWSTRILTWLES